jgi:hypothetical protein
MYCIVTGSSSRPKKGRLATISPGYIQQAIKHGKAEASPPFFNEMSELTY